MGLGQANQGFAGDDRRRRNHGFRRTSYGIHASNDPRAIGQPFSRGCVRMRPNDAEALFRLVPLGTPVTIHP